MNCHFVRTSLTLSVFLVVATCQAGQITATLNNTTNVGANGDPRLHLKLTGTTENVEIDYNRTGFLNWTRTAGTEVGPTFSTFCIELNANVNIGGSFVYNVVEVKDAPKPGNGSGGSGGMGQEKADAIARLWHAHFSSSMNTTQAAAFQLAIWRIEYDYDSNIDYTVAANANAFKNFTSGHMQANGNNASGNDAVTLASAWLIDSAIILGGAKASGLVALSNHNPDYQDQITQVPEPASALMATMGAIILGAARYRHRKTGSGSVSV